VELQPTPYHKELTGKLRGVQLFPSVDEAAIVELKETATKTPVDGLHATPYQSALIPMLIADQLSPSLDEAPRLVGFPFPLTATKTPVLGLTVTEVQYLTSILPPVQLIVSVDTATRPELLARTTKTPVALLQVAVTHWIEKGRVRAVHVIPLVDEAAMVELPATAKKTPDVELTVTAYQYALCCKSIVDQLSPSAE
jgi:hypothetical protein